ncbi:MAG: PAS domain S-box protein [Planctomycetes bacterium]|nr:PAS domain S-box protein [Planctomycetota bacterium]
MPYPPQFPHDLLALIDAAPVPVFAFDSAGRHTFVNATGCRVMRRDRDQILGRTMAEIGLPPTLGAKFDATVREVLATGAPQVQEATLPTPAGPVVMKVRLAPQRDAAGAVVGVVGVSADVTAEVAARHALRANEERYRRVVEDQTEVVCRFKGDGTFTFVNDVYCRVFGKSTSELLGHGWQPMVHVEDVALVESQLKTMSAANPVVVIENRVYDAAGRVRWMEFVNRGFYDPAGALVELQAVGRDVTDRRAAEDARRALEADLRVKEEQQKYERQLLQSQKLESLGVLAGGIAHDFNNLLTGILGYASLAQMRLPPGDPVNEDLKRIEAASQRAADLCQQMLAYAGRGQFVVQPVDLTALTEEMAQLLGTVISRKAVLKFNLTSGVPPVLADATQLRQTVMNLITNASDAIGATSGVITLTTGLIDADARYLAEVGAPELPAGPYVYLEVSDTGCGMTDEVRERMFDPFFTTKFTGRGLGLTAVLGIVRAHRGAIKVYSQVGKGTTFKVLLPALADGAATAPAAPAVPARDGRGRNVLVVDDEEDVRVFARKVLELSGFAVALAPDGRAGADAFAADPGAFAAVLLDLTMPRLNGADAYRAMRRHRADVRVVLMSGFAEQEATAGFEGKGLAGFLRKPFRADHLLDAVFAAVGG